MGSRRNLKKQRASLTYTLSEKYRKVGWIEKIGAGVSLFALIMLIAWRIEGNFNPTTLFISLGALVGVHLFLSYLAWTKVIIIGALTASAIPQVAAYFLNFDQYSFITSILILVTGAILVGILGYRYARGQYWITLAISQTILLFSGAAISVLFENYNTIFMGIGLAALFVILRSIKWRKKKAVSPVISDASKARKQIIRAMSIPSDGKLLVPPDEVEEYDALFLTKALRAGVLHRVKFSGGITRGKKGLRIGTEQKIDDFLAQKLLVSQAVAKKYKIPTPATILIVNDPGVRSDNITLMVRSKEDKTIGEVTLMHPTRVRQHLLETVNRNSGLLQEEDVYSLVLLFTDAEKESTNEDTP